MNMPPQSRYDRDNAKADFIATFNMNYRPGCVLSNPEWHAEKLFRIAEQLFNRMDKSAASESETPQGTKLSARWYESDALCFASELFGLLNYRRTHSLSRDIWHEADVSDLTGRRCIDFLRDRSLIEQHPENLTWWRFKDPEKRAKPWTGEITK